MLSLSTGNLTAEQKHKIHHLMQAKWALEKANQHIIDALGSSDVEQWYSKSIVEMLEELDTDMGDVHDNG